MSPVAKHVENFRHPTFGQQDHSVASSQDGYPSAGIGLLHPHVTNHYPSNVHHYVQYSTHEDPMVPSSSGKNRCHLIDIYTPRIFWEKTTALAYQPLSKSVNQEPASPSNFFNSPAPLQSSNQIHPLYAENRPVHRFPSRGSMAKSSRVEGRYLSPKFVPSKSHDQNWERKNQCGEVSRQPQISNAAPQGEPVRTEAPKQYHTQDTASPSSQVDEKERTSKQCEKIVDCSILGAEVVHSVTKSVSGQSLKMTEEIGQNVDIAAEPISKTNDSSKDSQKFPRAGTENEKSPESKNHVESKDSQPQTYKEALLSRKKLERLEAEVLEFPIQELLMPEITAAESRRGVLSARKRIGKEQPRNEPSQMQPSPKILHCKDRTKTVDLTLNVKSNPRKVSRNNAPREYAKDEIFNACIFPEQNKYAVLNQISSYDENVEEKRPSKTHSTPQYRMPESQQFSTYNLKVNHLAAWLSIGKYLEPLKKTAFKSWEKVWAVQVPFSSTNLPAFSVKELLRALRLRLPDKPSTLAAISNARSKLSRKIREVVPARRQLKDINRTQAIGQQDARKERVAEKNPILPQKISAPNLNFDDTPTFVQNYKKSHPAAGESTLKALQVLGKFLKVDSSDAFVAIHLDRSDIDWKIFQDHWEKLGAGENMRTKQIKWLRDRIGEVESGRRLEALARQMREPGIQVRWKMAMQDPKLKPSMTHEMISLGQLLLVNEQWPTFLHSRRHDAQVVHNFLSRRSMNEFMAYIFGKNELFVRLRLLKVMCSRKNPHDWLSASQMRSAYQQGLDVGIIIMVGDLLQFGRESMSFRCCPGVLSLNETYLRLGFLWSNMPKSSWNASPEKQWLLSETDTGELYADRLAYLKHALRLKVIQPEILNRGISIDFVKTSKPWWNLGDLLEWTEENLDPPVMAEIGNELRMVPADCQVLDMRKLKQIVAGKSLSDAKKKYIVEWFESKANPSKEKHNPQANTVFESIYSFAQDIKTGLLALWKRKVFV